MNKTFKRIVLILYVVVAVLLMFDAYLIARAFENVDVEIMEIESHPIVVDEEVTSVSEEDIEVLEEIVKSEYIKSDIQVIAETVEGEGGNQPLVGKVAIAATMLNRMERTGRTAESIALEAYNAYPYYGPVSQESYRAVEIAMENRDLFPDDMMYFRAGHYHDFGVPYCQIGDHYFSTKGE